MKKKNILITSLISIIVVLIIILLFLLISNKTFFSNTYIGVQKQEIFIPKYSYFKEECCMTVAFFYSLKSKEQLQQEIDEYMKDFEYFEDASTYGYKKDDLFIQSYKVVDDGIFRKITIVY